MTQPEPATLLARLQKIFPTAKRQNLKKMVQDGRVLINGFPAPAINRTVARTDRIEIAPRAAAPKSKLPFPIVHEDGDLLIVDKPAGLITSTGPRDKRPTALGIVRQYAAEHDRSAKIGLVHRLDRDASGLLVFSKNPTAHASLKKQFFHHTITRIYLAVVSPPPKSKDAKMQSNLIERADGTVHSTNSPTDGQKAISHYTMISSDKNRALLQVQLYTGRKHQIRVHLSELASAIVGDTVYGGAPNPTGLLLAAVELQLDHPRSGKRLTFKIPKPARFAANLS